MVGQRRWLAAGPSPGRHARGDARDGRAARGLLLASSRPSSSTPLGDRLYPGGTGKPFAMSHARATSAAEPPSAIAAFISRRSDVRSNADTAFSASASPRAERLERRLRDDRRDVLRGLQVAIVQQVDQAAGWRRRVAREQQPDVDRPVPQGLRGQRTPGIERDVVLEMQAVDILQSFETEGALLALRRDRRTSSPARTT